MIPRIFCGYDPREASGFHTFLQSVIQTTGKPFSIIPLSGEQRDGSNAFTYARFLVPYLCDFKGTAVFLDGTDMLMRADIAHLCYLADTRFAVQVVKHHYWTHNPRKYIGTEMEADNKDYPRKNWSSLIIWNCGHKDNARLTPEFVKHSSGSFLHRFNWLDDNQIGEIPNSWNVLIGESLEHPEPKIVHYTLGIPAIPYYRDAEYADEWQGVQQSVNQSPKQQEAMAVSK